MTPETLIDILRGALQVGGTIAGPTISFGLIAGVAVSIFQASTQINDFTLVFVPKVLATLLALILFGSWMLQTYLSFTRQIIISLPTLIGLGRGTWRRRIGRRDDTPGRIDHEPMVGGHHLRVGIWTGQWPHRQRSLLG